MTPSCVITCTVQAWYPQIMIQYRTGVGKMSKATWHVTSPKKIRLKLSRDKRCSPSPNSQAFNSRLTCQQFKFHVRVLREDHSVIFASLMVPAMKMFHDISRFDIRVCVSMAQIYQQIGYKHPKHAVWPCIFDEKTIRKSVKMTSWLTRILDQ